MHIERNMFIYSRLRSALKPASYFPLQKKSKLMNKHSCIGINFNVSLNKMKQVITLTVLLFCIHSSNAQGDEKRIQRAATTQLHKETFKSHPALKGKKVKRVPETVSSSFSTLFPGAQSVQWYKKDKLFRVQFMLREQSHIAVFDESGNRMD